MEAVVEVPAGSEGSSLSLMVDPQDSVDFDTGEPMFTNAVAVLDPEGAMGMGIPVGINVAPVLGDDEGGDPIRMLPPSSKKKKKRKKKDGCYKGQMQFEGKCWNKDKIDEILDQRQRAAMAKVYAAKDTYQTADAAYDLLEQQIAQMDKTEDDLDEIIEQLKEEAQDKKGD